MILALGGRGSGDGMRETSDPLFWGGIAILLIALVLVSRRRR
jgi:LPXTG-motif cell wall-anchored protein